MNKKEREVVAWKLEYQQNAHYFRGSLIDCFNKLEKTIENYIAKHFGLKDNVFYEFHHVVLDRLTFESKKDILNKIMNDKAIANGFIKTGNNKWPHSKLFKDIQEVKDERNAFAHYYLLIPNEPNENVIVLAEFRDNPEAHHYTLKEFNGIIQKINEATRQIYKLYRVLSPRLDA